MPDLPAPLTRLIGREQELAAVQALLAQHRLVTLTGPGGTGKSRLALAVAAGCSACFADGTVVVALASLQDPALIPAAIATALDVREVPGRPPIESLVAFLQPRTLLLVLDNCEHLPAGMSMVSELLQRCAGLHVLATSRAPLHLSGERRYPLLPLPVPESAQAELPTLAENAAIALFCERVQAVRPAFGLTAENAGAVVEICRRLDGLPLALELAASRCVLFPPNALLARLERRLPVLTDGPRDAPARQRTLRDTITWSYELLSTAEQTLFCRLAVFAGGCTLEAAEAVCNPNGDLDALAGLTALVDQHLLVQRDGAGGEPRFGMLETIREFALERLASSSGMEDLRGRHAAYLLGLAQQSHFDVFVPTVREAAIAQLAAEQDNLRAALAWCLAGGGDRIAGVQLGSLLAGFWIQHQQYTEGHGWLQQALAVEQVPLMDRARLLVGASYLALMRTDYEAMRIQAEAGLMLWRELDQPRGVASALKLVGGALTMQGRLEAGRAAAEESISLWRRLGGGIGLGEVLAVLSSAARSQGDLSTVQAAVDERLTIARALKHGQMEIEATKELGRLAFDQGDTVRARRLLEECLVMRRQRADGWFVGVTLLELAQIALAEADTARARACGEEAFALFQELGIGVSAALALEGLGHAHRLVNDGRAAAERYAESLKLFRAAHSDLFSLYPLAGLAWTALWLDRPPQSGRLLAAARALLPRRPGIIDHGTYAWYQADVTAVRSALGEGAFAAAWAEGETLSLVQATTEALALAEEIAGLPEDPSPAAFPPIARSSHPDGLTAREVEVLRLIAAGRSTREIAAALVIAEATVTRHVTNLYGKIGARGRADATAYAFRHQLVSPPDPPTA